jgi:hypothetical protein
MNTNVYSFYSSYILLYKYIMKTQAKDIHISKAVLKLLFDFHLLFIQF